MSLKEKIDIPKDSLGEELVSAISHGIGGLLSVAALVLCVVFSAIHHDPYAVVSSVIYGSTSIILYTMSTLYHSFKVNNAKRVFRIIDHCSIFLLIAGTYTPYTLVPLRGPVGWTLFGIIWGAAIIGIVFNSISLEKAKKLSLVCYVAMGWAIIFAIKPMIASVTKPSLVFLLIGGIFYTAGIVFYAVKKIRYFHSVWHLFTVGGTVFHYFSILLIMLND